jgi:hypothetical protein
MIVENFSGSKTVEEHRDHGNSDTGDTHHPEFRGEGNGCRPQDLSDTGASIRMIVVYDLPQAMELDSATGFA